MLLLLQQVCTMSCLATLLVPYLMDKELLLMDDLKSKKNAYVHVAFQAKECARYFLHNVICMLSLLQSLDVYVMICWPLNYSAFCETKSFLKYLSFGSVSCLLLSLDDLLTLFTKIQLYFFSDSNTISIYIDLITKDSVVYRANIFKVIKIPLVKFIFVSVIVKMANSVRKSLKQSEGMGNHHAGNLSLRLYLYTLLPILFGLLLLPHEILSVVRDFGYSNKSILFREDIIFVMAACTYTLASITYYMAYLILFRSVREALCGIIWICKKE